MQEEIKILKVKFNRITLKEATEKAIKWASENQQRYITTPNPEFLLEAQKNKAFLKVLNKSDLNTADGTGILWASRYIYNKKTLPERVTGTDLMQKICEKAKITKNKIFLLGAGENIAETTKTVLENKYKGIKITGTFAGTPKEEDEEVIIEKINKSAAEILFVAYGAPNQELWIAKNLKKLKSVKVAMGVGGAFDFIAGARKRAPKWMQKIGLEWLYRLAQQPSRIKRIYNATVKFPIIVIKNT